MTAEVFKNHLQNDLIPFWNKMTDNDFGGFFGAADWKGVPDPKSIKGGILNSRILWFYSSTYSHLKDEKLLDSARHAYEFLKEHVLDHEYGGIFWSLTFDGHPDDTTKHTYNQAFAIYALSAYYIASGDKEALDLAYDIYELIESKCKDSDGYLEAFERDFKPSSDNDKLSENGVMAQRTMNTLLHVFEAYTELYRADRSERVGSSLKWIFSLFERIYDPEREILQVFFDMDYNSLIDLESFGHDIEASWLIDRGCKVLANDDCTRRMQPIIDGLARSAYNNGFDQDFGAMNNECERGKIDKQKIWWVQAETVIGLYNSYQRNPENTEHLDAAEKTLDFIFSKVVDKATGEWIESIGPEGIPAPEQQLVRLWKCPYHNGRMCLEMMDRLGK